MKFGMQPSPVAVGAEEAMASQAQLSFDRPEHERLVVRISGSWLVAGGVPAPSEVQAQLESGPPIARIQFDTQSLRAWDTGLLIFLRNLRERFADRQIEVDDSGLPDGACSRLTCHGDTHN